MDYLLRESYLAQLRAVNRSPDTKVSWRLRKAPWKLKSCT